MFPLRDDNPTYRIAIVTMVLVVANIAVWLYVQGAGASAEVLGRSVCQFGAIPAEITGRTGEYGGVDLGPGMPPCYFGGLSTLTVVTSMFLHGGWLHLIANLWFLWLFGNNVEDAMGRARYLAFYLLCGGAAALAQILSAPAAPVPMVGASGAISGLMGAYLLLYPRIRIQTIFIFVIFIRIIPMPAWFVLILWFGLQLLSGWGTPVGRGGVAVWAHVGGFVAGVLFVKVFENRKLLAERRRRLALDRTQLDHLG